MSSTTDHARQPEILIVEDNFLTACEVGDMVRDCGYAIAGTAARINRGFELLDTGQIDGAIVDINLNGSFSFPLCAELDRRKVPYCFLTGYPSSIIPPDFRTARLLTKPCDRDQIRAALTGLLGERPVPSGTHAGAPDGFLLAVGDGIKPGAELRSASVLDVAPTILYLMGLPVARDMEGRVLGEIVEEDFARAHPVTFIPSYESLAVTASRASGSDLPPLPDEVP